MPCSQGSKGRDHNPFAFTSWLAGGGIKGGVTYGASDEWSYKAVENATYCYDLHATVLHLLGIDHTRADVPPQRHRPPPDRRARACHQGDPGVRNGVGARGSVATRTTARNCMISPPTPPSSRDLSRSDLAQPTLRLFRDKMKQIDTESANLR